MSISVVNYPVTVESGIIKNVFAGFNPVEITFQRKDIETFNVGAGADNKILITVATDLTANLNLGEWVYLYAEGVGFTYDNSFKIIDLNFSSPNTNITVDGDYIVVASTGYINYKQNYFVDGKIVSPSNNLVKLYPYNISDDGTASGIINLNVSAVVDYLNSEILEISGEVPNNCNRFNVMFREVWRENLTNSFTLINETPIIITKTADNSAPEKFVNDFEIPKIWAGYPFVISFLHSIDNNFGLRIACEFDELDINETAITLDNPIVDFSPNINGLGQVAANDIVTSINSDTNFLRFNLITKDIADYAASDYNSTDYLTI